MSATNQLVTFNANPNSLLGDSFTAPAGSTQIYQRGHYNAINQPMSGSALTTYHTETFPNTQTAGRFHTKWEVQLRSLTFNNDYLVYGTVVTTLGNGTVISPPQRFTTVPGLKNGQQGWTTWTIEAGSSTNMPAGNYTQQLQLGIANAGYPPNEVYIVSVYIYNTLGMLSM